jgi:hypothetical protein
MTTRSLLLVLLTAGGCGVGATTGRTVALHTRLATELPADGTVTTNLGWTVTVTKAVVASGALYYFDGAPALTRAPRRDRWRRALAALSPVGAAWAHPGHYLAGSARGQMLTPFSADLLAGPTELPDGDGISGPVRSGTFSFAAPAAGPALERLDGHVAAVEGTAAKAGTTIHFAITSDLQDVTRNARDGAITGCLFNEADIEGDGTVTATVRPKIWFDLVDFAELPPGAPDAPTVVDPSTTAYIAFSLGLVQLSAYQFAYTPESSR